MQRSGLVAKLKKYTGWLLLFLAAVALVAYLPLLAGALVCAYWASRVQGGAYVRTTAAFVAGWIFTFFSLNFLEVCVFMVMAPLKEIFLEWRKEVKAAKEAAEIAIDATLATEGLYA